MGRRIHKALGYAVRLPDWRNDVRPIYPKWRASWNEFLYWCGENLGKIVKLSGDTDFVAQLDLKRRWNQQASSMLPLFSRCIIHDDEAIPELLLIIPPDLVDKWYRYDDDIDLVEALALGPANADERRVPRAITLESDELPLRHYPAGKPPAMVVAIAMYLGLERFVGELKETLYVWYS